MTLQQNKDDDEKTVRVHPGLKYGMDTDETQLPGLHEVACMCSGSCVCVCASQTLYAWLPAGAGQVWEDEEDTIIFVEPHQNPLFIPSDTEADCYSLLLFVSSVNLLPGRSHGEKKRR